MEFQGRLRKIYPKRLINPEVKDELQTFFLTLGMIYNDFKNLILFEKLVVENYRKPKKDEVSAHAGEYGGVLIWVHKNFVAYINEFFLFIKENKGIIESNKFQEIISGIGKKK